MLAAGPLEEIDAPNGRPSIDEHPDTDALHVQRLGGQLARPTEDRSQSQSRIESGDFKPSQFRSSPRLHRGGVVGHSILAGRIDVTGDATLLKIPNSKVREKLAADPAFASRFYRALCVFLADRLRHNTLRMGYGSAFDEHAKDELNDDLLDNVVLAGARFDRMLKRMAG